MDRTIGLLVLGIGLGFPTAAPAGVIVQTSLNLNTLQISPSFGVVQIVSPFSASANAQAQDDLSGSNSAFNQVVDGSTPLTAVATAFASAGAYASSSGDLTSLLTAYALSGVDIGATSSASSTGQGGLGGDFGGSGLFEIFDSSNPSPSNVNVTFTASLSGSQSLATDAFGQSATSEIVFNLFLPDIGATPLFLDNPLSIGPGSSLAAPYSGTLTGAVTLQTNTDYTLIAEVDAESSGLNLTPEPSSSLLTALGLFAVLYAGWRAKGNRAKRHNCGAC